MRLLIIYRSPLSADLTGAGLPKARAALVRCTQQALTQIAQGTPVGQPRTPHAATFRITFRRNGPASTTINSRAKSLLRTKWHPCAAQALTQLKPRLTGPGKSARVTASVLVR